MLYRKTNYKSPIFHSCVSLPEGVYIYTKTYIYYLTDIQPTDKPTLADILSARCFLIRVLAVFRYRRHAERPMLRLAKGYLRIGRGDETMARKEDVNSEEMWNCVFVCTILHWIIPPQPSLDCEVNFCWLEFKSCISHLSDLDDLVLVFQRNVLFTNIFNLPYMSRMSAGWPSETYRDRAYLYRESIVGS